MDLEVYNLVSNYYKGELASLFIKLMSSFFFIVVSLLMRYYFDSNFIVYFSYNIIVILSIIFSKSVYQIIQYKNRRNNILSLAPIDTSLEKSYILKREEILTKHRRFHIYNIFGCSIVLCLFFILDVRNAQVVAIPFSLFLISCMLLSFSLFNSFRLSEYKFLMSKFY